MSATSTMITADQATELHALIAEHAWLLDRGDVTQLASLYTPDGSLTGLEKPLVGRDAIAEWSRWRGSLRERTSRHVHTNIRLFAESADELGASMITLLYRYEGDGTGPTTPLLVLDYDDVYRRHDGRWLIHERVMRRVFVDAARIGAPT